ncbi:MAG: hypothetical protein PUA84_04085 [Oscillospiraceae bacterium]|nr:hypothetical protein [Oscillospiraceae bacterium]
MNEKMPLSLSILYSVSREISSEKSDGILLECRKIKRNKQDEVYEIRKKREAVKGILAKIQRMSQDD